MPTSRETALEAARIADAHKAGDLRVLDLRRLFMADYFVIATIQNRHHGRAIAEALVEALKARGLRPLGISGMDEGAWVLVDLGDVVVHLFEAEYRSFYDLEMLWGDAPKVAWKASPRPKAAAKRARA